MDAFNQLALKFEAVQSDVRVTRHAVDAVTKSVVAVNEELMDVWTESNKSPISPEEKQAKKQAEKESQDLFKLALCEFYKVSMDHEGNLACMLTGLKLPATRVTAAHLMKKSKPELLGKFGLKSSQINHARHGLLLAEAIKAAFDAKDICFEPVPLHNKLLRCRVLNPNLKNRPVYQPFQRRLFPPTFTTPLCLFQRTKNPSCACLRFTTTGQCRMLAERGGLMRRR